MSGSNVPTRLAPSWLFGAIAGLLAVGLSAATIGPADLSAPAVVRELLDAIPFVHIDSGLSELQRSILWEIRLPRVVLGGLVGATLSGAGGAYQGVFQNPLADPYLLGVAAGAGLGATIAIVTGVGSAGVLPFAFIGAIAAVVLTYAIGYSVRLGRTATTLILAGVAVSAFLTAAQTYLQQRRADTLREVYSWILGRLSTVGWGEVTTILPYVVVSLAALVAHRRALDVMSVGDEEAAGLGMHTTLVRASVVVAATLGTAAAVAVGGLIGFVGIIVPHTVRLVAGPSYRRILPLSIVGGAAFLILADLLARTAASPAEVPIGVITAFFGAPFFAVLLRNREAVPV